MDKNAIRSEVQNAGIAFQLGPNMHLQFLSATSSLGRSMYKSFNCF